jgi:class 3 adenylate cyclase
MEVMAKPSVTGSQISYVSDIIDLTALAALAAPDTVLISEATYRLVQGYVSVDALGPQALRGVSAPVPRRAAWRWRHRAASRP